jgi:hypothetical protein
MDCHISFGGRITSKIGGNYIGTVGCFAGKNQLAVIEVLCLESHTLVVDIDKDIAVIMVLQPADGIGNSEVGF